jgi:D-alanine--poly(phosphoribitol) ligase subunit 1
VVESSYLAAIEDQALVHPGRVAFENSRGERLTYAELKAFSDALACWLAANPAVRAKAPLLVYGHKSPLMLVCFLACMKSGHAYVPVDTVYPLDRVANIAAQVGNAGLLDTIGTLAAAEAGPLACPVFGPDELRRATVAFDPAAAATRAAALDGLHADDAMYLLFTSGSTGAPKGVEVSADCVDGFARWMCDDYVFPAELDAAEPADAEHGARVWFNRTPYSFDVSLTDMACGLTRGDSCFANEAEADASLAATFEALARSNATDWVSTPSFAEQCLADPSFGAALMPRLRRMLLAGETLRPETVRRLHERFPGLAVYNGYGPTESTDLITLCEIRADMLAADRALPIGYAKPRSDLFVLDPQTLEEIPDGQPGELFVAGDTVARGYWGRPDLTEAAFHSCPAHLAAGRRSYRTGDEVTREADGLIYFHGRLDLQVKLHGYRIELGDVEAALSAVPEVAMAVVLPVVRNGAVAHLTAVVVPHDLAAPRGLALTKRIKAAARANLPAYMIPSSFKYLDQLPLNQNGKADRKAIAALVGA